MSGLSGLFARLKEGLGFSNKDRPATPAPAAPARTPAPVASPVNSSPSVVGGAAGAPASIDLAGTEFISGENCKIAVPAAGPICLLCSRPGYDRAKGEGTVICPDDIQGDDDKMKGVLKVFVLAARVVCPGCQGVFCWSCLVAPSRPFPELSGDSSWECPRCHGKIPDCPAHRADAGQVLTSQESTEATLALFHARDARADKPTDAVRKELTGASESPGAVYFGVRYAMATQVAIGAGLYKEDDLRLMRLRVEFLAANTKLSQVQLWVSQMERLPKENMFYDEESLTRHRAELPRLLREYEQLKAELESRGL